VHVQTERQKVLSKHFLTSQKRPYHVTFELDVDLEHILDAGSNGDNRVQVWWRSSHVCGRSSDLRAKVYRRTDRRTTDASRLHKLTRGRVRAGPRLQLGTLSTRIANLLCIIHSALSRLLPCLRTAAVLRTAHTLGHGGPLRGQTDGQTRLTNSQPDNRTAAVLPVPSCKLGIHGMS